MIGNYLSEAFKELDLLNEDVFDFSTTGAEDLKNFMENDTKVDYEVIIDPNAETEDELKDSYIGKVVLCCEVCHSDIYKDKEDVVIDDETQLANVGEDCPYCYSVDGYKIVGQIAPYSPNADFSIENGEVEPKEDKSKEAPAEEETDVDVTEIDVVPEEDSDEDLEEAKKEDKVKTDLSKVEGSMTKVLMDKADEIKDLTSKSDLYNFVKDLFEKNEIDTKASRRLLITISKAKSDFEAISAVHNSMLKGAKLGVIESKLNESVMTEAIGEVRTLTQSEIDEFGVDALPDGSGPFAIDDDNFTLILHGDQGDAVAIEYFDDSDGNPYTVGFEFIDKDDAVSKFKDVFDYIKKNPESVKEEFVECVSKPEKLTEDVKTVTVETDTDTTNVQIGENGGVTVDTQPNAAAPTEEASGEMIAPVSPGTIADIEDNTQDEEIPEDDMITDVDVADLDEIDETSFDELGESYLKEVYRNVKSFKTTSGKLNNDTIKLEGVIEFNSGKKALTEFSFRSYTVKNGVYKFLGENLQINPKKCAYILDGRIDNNKFIAESLNYSYRSKNSDGKSVRIYGTVKK